MESFIAVEAPGRRVKTSFILSSNTIKSLTDDTANAPTAAVAVANAALIYLAMFLNQLLHCF